MTAYEAMRVCPACVDHKGRSLVRVTFTDPRVVSYRCQQCGHEWMVRR